MSSSIRERETEAGVRRAAHDRLHPGMTNPNWLVLRARRKLFTTWLTRLDSTSLRVLDVGGRLQPYRPLLNGRIAQYYSVDLLPGPCVNAVGGAENLPFAGGQFDLVFCTQMLEYVPSPQMAIDEIHRVLRPSGCLFLSAPAVFLRDSDPEYWRFLPASLRLLLRNFTEVEVAPEGSSITGLLRTLNVSLITFSPQPLRSALRYTVTPALNAVAVVLERLASTSNDQLTANFSVFARK